MLTECLSDPRSPRCSFATHLLMNGYDIRTVPEILGHYHLKTIMIYTHVLNRGGRGVKSPADLHSRAPCSRASQDMSSSRSLNSTLPGRALRPGRLSSESLNGRRLFGEAPRPFGSSWPASPLSSVESPGPSAASPWRFSERQQAENAPSPLREHRPASLKPSGIAQASHIPLCQRGLQAPPRSSLTAV